MAFDSKKFLVRTGSAAVFVVLLLGCILWNYYSFSALFFVISLWGLHEFYTLMELNGAKANRWVGFVAAGFLYLHIFFNQLMYDISMTDLLLTTFLFRFRDLFFYLCLAVLFVIFIIELFRNTENPFQNISVTVTGILYVVLPFYLLNRIGTVPVSSSPFPPGWITHVPGYHYQSILGMFLLIWSNDTFAYLVGSFLGKNKMFERISPGKTWEGTIGGGILTIAASFLIWKWFGLFELYDWMVIAGIVVVFGTLGDLVESMLKRSVGVKDSGKIMPGHGGILDRFDSLIMVAPFVFLYLLLK